MSVYKDKRTGHYGYNFMYKGRRYHRVFPEAKTKDEVEGYEQIARANLRKKGYEIIEKLTPPLAELVKDYDEYKETAYTRPHEFDYVIKRFVKITGNKMADEIILNDFLKYQNIRAKEVKASTVNREMDCIKRIFSLAKQNRKIQYNPCDGLEDLRIENPPERYLTKEEERQLLEVANPIMKAMIIVAVYPNDNYKIDILIATDCISEGQNLQDCDYLVNYDIHWNPVRIIQRFGRIDRIGSKNEQIQLVNFWADVDLDEYINLKARVETRMKITIMTSTGAASDNVIDDIEKKDLEYRKKQLERLQTEVVDLEEMNTGINIMDLGLNEFRLDLLNYMKTNPDVESCPYGMHAVVKATEMMPEGVVYILKNVTNAINMRHSEKIIRSILFDNKYSSRKGTAELESIFKGKIFTFPKPLSLVKDYLQASTKDDNLVMDFFSGSATTAHAVMQLNAEDGGNRKFIMVQLPEITDEKSEAYKAGYKTICEIGEERIRRAGKKIQEENPDKKLDTGFRVFKVDDTNMKDVYYSPHEFKQGQLGIFESNIKDDRTDEDLLYEVLLNSGVELSLPHRVETIDGKRVHFIQSEYSSTPDLIACFEQEISENLVRTVAGYKPTKVVFRDSSFNSDANRINVEEIFKLLTPDTRVKVL